MDSLDFLVDKKLLTATYRPIKPISAIKVVSSGVIFQQRCHNGLPYDIAVSWLQKSIRLGLTEQAYYCAYHIAELGKLFRSHLLNRLITILSEDIGPAEPQLASIIEGLYFESRALEKEGRLDEVQNNIIKMITYLSKARKSRITDWLIHDCDVSLEPNEEFETAAELVHMAVVECKKRTKLKVKVKVSYGETVTEKQLAVYEIWVLLLDICSPCHTEDIVSLLRLFMVRGPEYGILHLAHAITLVYMSNPVSIPILPELPIWSSFKDLDPPILNSAVDMHTFYGRKYLGRTMLDFLRSGSVLKNWTPFPDEIELITKFTAALDPPIIEDSVPRKYQKEIVETALRHLSIDKCGWLLMACGTGKTKTSYWIMKKHLAGASAGASDRLFIVITPFLEILRQFYMCWAAMNRMHQIKSISGIMASCTDVFEKDDYSNFEYINGKGQLDAFLTYPDKIKFIFTTYASLPKLLDKGLVPDLVVYDEAHHLKFHKMFHCGHELFLTATPHQSAQSFGHIIARYNLRNAIDDGFLTPYKVGIFEISDNVDCLVYIQNIHKKTIVYCKNNSLARGFYHEWLDRGGEDANAFYVDCKTPKKERLRIFSAYRNNERSVIFNCAILGEGVDFTDCDSILIQSGYISPTRVVQAMGRPLRLNRGKDIAGVYMLNDDKVGTRLSGMSQYDPNVWELVEYLE